MMDVIKTTTSCIDYRQLKEFSDQGFSDRAISANVGCSIPSVQTWRKETHRASNSAKLPVGSDAYLKARRDFVYIILRRSNAEALGWRQMIC